MPWTRVILGIAGSTVVSSRPDTFHGVIDGDSLKLNAATNQIILDADEAVNKGTVTMAALTAARTWTLPDATDTLVGKATTDTLTNKTLTSPTISSPALSGTATGTYTLGGTPTISAPTLTGSVPQFALTGDPGAALEVSTKQYVDGKAEFSVLNVATSTETVANTTTETNLYSFSVPGGTLSTNKRVWFRAEGDHLENAAGNLTLRVKYGASTILTLSGVDVADAATRRPWSFDVHLVAKGATNSQIADGYYIIGSSTGTDGTMSIATTREEGYGNNNAVAEDSTVAANFVLTAQWSAASANLSVRLLTAMLAVPG